MSRLFNFIVLILLGTVLPAQEFKIYTQDFTSNGDTIWNQIDEYGKKQGYWQKLYPNKKLAYKGYFISDKPVGKMTRYHDNGKIKAEIIYDTLTNTSSAKIYYVKGKLASTGYYKDKIRDSVWHFYSYYTGNLSGEEIYKNGKKNGRFTYYFNDGTTAQILDWVNDIEHGDWKEYYENGALKMEAKMENGERNGLINFYFPNGSIEISGLYKNSKREGTWSYFDPAGNKKLELIYKDGRLLNEDKLTEVEKAIFEEFNSNIGKIQEPSESIYPQ